MANELILGPEQLAELERDINPDAEEKAEVAPEKSLEPAPKMVDGNVLLVNIRHPNELVFLPKDRKIYPQHYVQFTEGYLQCSPEVADRVLKSCPWAYKEPDEGDVHTFPDTGFKTRNTAAYNQYVRTYWENNG